jgi:hypothetical protein
MHEQFPTGHTLKESEHHIVLCIMFVYLCECRPLIFVPFHFRLEDLKGFGGANREMVGVSGLSCN